MTLHILRLPKLIAERRSTAILGMTIIVMLWAGIIMKYFESVDNDRREAVRTNQNFAMLFEENVLRSIGEIDKALLYLRRTVETRKGSADYHSFLQSSDVLSEIIVQAAIVDEKGIIRWSNARSEFERTDQRRRPRAHQGPAQEHRGPSLCQQAGHRPRQRPVVGAVHAPLLEERRQHRRRRGRFAQSRALCAILRQDRSRIVRLDLHDRQRRRGARQRRQRPRALQAGSGSERHEDRAPHAGRGRSDLRGRRRHRRRRPIGHHPQGPRPSALGERQRQQRRHLQALLGQSAGPCHRRNSADPVDPGRHGANPAHGGQSAAKSRSASAHLGEHEPRHHAGHQGPADSDHQQQVRRAAESARRIHRASAAPGPAGRVPGPDRRLARPGDVDRANADRSSGCKSRGGAIHHLRTQDAERNRDRGSQRTPSRRQPGTDLHGRHQTVRGGGPCGPAGVGRSVDRPSEPARVQLDARSAEPASGSATTPGERNSPSCSSISIVSRSSTTRSAIGSATCSCRTSQSD